MYRKSNKEPQIDVFTSIPHMLDKKAGKHYNNAKGWHNLFREHITLKIDETPFRILFDENMGAPNAPIPVLLGMMIMKEAFGYSDSQLFEQCRFNLLARAALGLTNINDTIPVESTYYLFRKRIYEHQRLNDEDLMEKVFQHITSEQIKVFGVKGDQIRMDSKLIGSNIALYSRYEVIHQTLTGFYKSIDPSIPVKLAKDEKIQLTSILEEEAQKTVYRSTKEEIRSRLDNLGIIIFKTLKRYKRFAETPAYQLLERVFNEQYKLLPASQVELRPKEEIKADSLQSPHDPDCTYRHKGDQQVKGYSVNITETNSDQGLNLITSVEVEKANTPDTQFVKPAIEKTIEVTQQKIEKVYADGAYQSPAHDEYCQGIDMVYTGIQGASSRYDLEMTPEGLMVTDTKTGEQVLAVLAKKTKVSKEDRWKITDIQGDTVYFGQQAIRASELRRTMKTRPIEELQKRNNVEATIFQFSYPLRNNKSKYRGLLKQRTFAYCRCLYINLVRIVLYEKQLCQRTLCAQKNGGLFTFFRTLLTSCRSEKNNWIEKWADFFITICYRNQSAFYR